MQKIACQIEKLVRCILLVWDQEYNMDNDITKNVDNKDTGRRVSALEMRISKPGYRIHDGITSMTNDTTKDTTNELPKYIPKYGWNPDIPDHRDYQYSTLRKKIDEENIIASDNISSIREYKVSTIDGTQPPVPSPLSFIDLRPMDSPIFDQGALGCHDDQTDVLTDKGWKKFKDIIEEDELATVNPETLELIYEKPTKIYNYHYVGKMIRGKHKFLDFNVTPNHRMLVSKWVQKNRKLDDFYTFEEAEDLGWYSGLINNVVWNGIYKDENYLLHGVDHKQKEQREDILIPMKAWLRFLGVYLADGTMAREEDDHQYKIQIAAKKEEKRKFVEETLTNIGINYLLLNDRITFNNKRIFYALDSLGLKFKKAPEKFVPPFVFELSSENIKEFLLGHFECDGCAGKEESKFYGSHYTSSWKLAEDIQRLLFLSGIETHLYVRDPRESVMKDGRIIHGNYPEHRISVCNEKNLSIYRKNDISLEFYDGEVYCADVPSYHTLVTRRNNQILISGNSCTGNALAGALQFLEKKDKVLYIELSRLFVYYDERVEENTINIDSGAQIRDGIKTLAKLGVCSEICWPYNIQNFAVQPGHNCYREAANHRILSYYRINTLDEMVHCLNSGYPFVFGFSVYDSFESEEVANTGIVNMPTGNEQLLGGHAVMAIGYDMNKKRFLVRNSWGINWGQQGYFTIPYDYLENRNLSDDFWCIIRSNNL